MEQQRQQGFARSLTDDDNPNLTAALHYAASGFRIVPLWPIDDHGHCTCAAGARCNAAGKHPHVTGWKHGEATPNPHRLRRWWGRWPTAGLGAVLDGVLIAVDVDMHTPKANGRKSLAEFERTHGALPETLTHWTGSDGLHLILRVPNGSTPVESIDGMLPGIDIKGRGGLLVLPPSPHPSGNNYRVELDAPIATAPATLLSFVDISRSERARKSEAPCFSQGSGAQRARALSESEAGPVPQGRRRDVLRSELGRHWNRATFTKADAYAYAEDYQRTRCATGTRPFTITEAHDIAAFITSTTKKTHATPAPSSTTMTETRRELIELQALAELRDWRALAKKWGTGAKLKRPGDVTRAGNSLRHVYATILGIANERDTLTPALAVREVAERGRMGRETAGAHMRTLRLAGLLRLSESWGRRTRAIRTGAALAASYTIPTAAEVCSTGTVPPTGGGARICTRTANFPAWLLATRALGRHAPRVLAALEQGEWQSNRALGRSLGISDAPMSRLLGLFELYGLAERMGKRGWRRGPVALTDLAEHQDDRLTAARRAAEAQQYTHRAEREADRWRHRLVRTIGEKPKPPSKLALVPGIPETGENDRTGSRRSAARRPVEPSAWGKTEENPPDERAEHMGGGRW